jgi:uncharacterized oligopeptide transporter (OPT) family protein
VTNSGLLGGVVGVLIKIPMRKTLNVEANE